MCQYDCVVLGTGNAGLCAAISAVEAGCDPSRVLMIEKAPIEWAGGNSYFTAGAFRTVHSGMQDLLPVVKKTETDQTRLDRIEMDPYTREQFIEDILRLGDRKSNMALVNTVVGDSTEVISWLAEYVGVRYIFSAHRQAYEIDGKLKFWGGLVLAVQDGGKGLVEDLMNKARALNIQFKWGTSVIGLELEDGERIRGVRVIGASDPPKEEVISTKTVIMACGGFEANEEMRTKYLGPDWHRAHVRGTPYNQGDGFNLVLNLPPNLQPRLVGDWSGCHSTCWDFNSPEDGGARTITNAYTKSGYPLGLMLNSHGRRYVDEGADFRNYTYAIYGRATLAQPNGFAFQIFDKKGKELLRTEEYGDNVTRKIEAPSVEILAEMLIKEGLEDPAAFLDTIKGYNEEVRAFQKEFPERLFDPSVKDGLRTQSLGDKSTIPKSNWARALDEAPFVAVKITCGITFTFGGLPIDAATAAVLRPDGQKLDGLFCAGEMVGDLFWNNYPGGSGLTAGAVFGRRAGKEVGRLANTTPIDAWYHEIKALEETWHCSSGAMP